MFVISKLVSLLLSARTKKGAKTPTKKSAHSSAHEGNNNVHGHLNSMSLPNEDVSGSFLGLVGYHDHGFVIARPAPPSAPWLRERVLKLHERLGGMANITDGLRRGFDLINMNPKGVKRTLWLLSNKAPNRELRALFPVVHACRDAEIAINTVGIGWNYDKAMLAEISDTSYRGRHHRLYSAHDLGDILTKTQRRDAKAAKDETTVIVIDCSHSMADRMGTTPKIDAVQEAVLSFISHQQTVNKEEMAKC